MAASKKIKIVLGCCGLVLGTIFLSTSHLDVNSIRKIKLLTVANETSLRLQSSTPSTHTEQPESKNKTILIISWTNLYVAYNPWFKEGTAMFEKCDLPEGVKCEYYHDRKLYDRADAVYFKGDNIRELDMPLNRRRDQLWIFYEFETFKHRIGRHWRNLANIFNITSSYSTQADLTTPYGECRMKKTTKNEIAKVKNYAENKTHLVAWFVSNCNPASRRQEYVNELKKHVKVDIYGKCGNMSCGNCKQDLDAKYKFYLAFENSFCGDYITEKFWRSLTTTVVPIVLGLADYKRYAPPHSYIDIRDFRSPKQLAEYLLLLDKRDDLYNEYFRWKPSYDCAVIPYFSQSETCRMCNLIHKRKHLPPNIPFNVSRIYEGAAQCQDTDTFIKNCDCWPKQ